MPAKAEKTEHDAVIVGSGPNGLAAAGVLAEAGLSVVVFEGAATAGGGMRSAELTQPGFVHDVCSAFHPLGAGSPVFSRFPLKEHGLEWVHPPVKYAHPLDDGEGAGAWLSLEKTAEALGLDRGAYSRLFESLVRQWDMLLPDLLAPLHFPKHPLMMARFGLRAFSSASSLVDVKFKTEGAKALFGGVAAHSMLQLDKPLSAAVGLVLGAAAHTVGWPMPRGGTQRLADALISYVQGLGVEIVTDYMVWGLDELPRAKVVLLDVTPRQFLDLAEDLPASYRSDLSKYRYGPGVFKIDWALEGPIPFVSEVCNQAGVVHVGGTFAEVAEAEDLVWRGKHPERPFILLAQQSRFDASRAPEGKQTAWGYCHVPNGSMVDMTEAIEGQIDRFAPGFRDLIIGRHTMHAMQMEEYNPNYVGGDINGGVQDIGQFFARPTSLFSPYKTPLKGVYLCSSATPPGGGVHGMCGYHAAQRALRDMRGNKQSM